MRGIAKYVDLAEKKEEISVTVIQADRTNKQFVAFFGDDQNGDITIVVPMRSYYSGEEEAEKCCKDGSVNYLLGSSLKVKVVDVNQIRNVVICECCPESKFKGISSSDISRKEVRDEFDKAIEAGKPYVCEARVITVSGVGGNSFAIFLYKGIRIGMFCRNWSYDYTNAMQDVVKVGQKVKIAIIEKNSTTLRVEYLASRAVTLPNPWSGIGDRFHKGDTVLVTLVHKWHGGFSGRIDGLTGVLVYVELPREKGKDKLPLAVGGKYVCGVANINEETRSFRVHPYAMFQSAEQGK